MSVLGRMRAVGDMLRAGLTGAVVLVSALAGSGCSLIYPEGSTPIRAIPKDTEVQPDPPKELLYIRFAEVVIPERTRDGRQWDAVGGSLPDPFAKLIIGEDRVLIETPIERDTLVATWPDQVVANYSIPRNSKLRIEIWDDNALSSKPICVKPFRGIHEEAEFGELRLRCDSGTRVTLAVEPARARWGIGMSYEIGGGVVRLTSVYKYSPVSRAGLAVDDEIVALDGRRIETMDSEQVSSAINANSRRGFKVQVKTANGRTRELTLKEGPIYPTQAELKRDRALGRGSEL